MDQRQDTGSTSGMPTSPPSTPPPPDRRSSPDWGGLIFAGLLIAVGVWFLLRDTLGIDLPDLSWDKLWPVLLILLGLAVILGGATGRRRRRS